MGGEFISIFSNADQLTGGEDNDILTGGGGNDRFIFDINMPYNTQSNTTLYTPGTDRITDFNTTGDRIVLDKTTFTGLAGIADGVIPTQYFASVITDAEAETSSAMIVYNRTTGALFYNSNGATAGFGVTSAQFATLTNLANLTAAHILLQA